ncbi:hypothetical protein [Paenibacillus luteus]|uniref:hypothetical protein n=1 Tax=Paenibacillus luteus TaxID=2545753 RepID=UPI001143E83A|nr:hypothetical protein [Paenibacillus luteus]
MLGVIIITILMVIGLLMLLVYLIILSIKGRNSLRDEARARGAYAVITAEHFEGLGINKEWCKIFALEQEIQIESKGTQMAFHVPVDRIRSVLLKNSKQLIEMDTTLRSHMLLGGPEALKASKKNMFLYIIINYESGAGELRRVLFRAEAGSFGVAPFILRVNKSLAAAQSGRIIDL